MELFALLSIILFYLLTPGILVNIKGNKYTIAICHAIIFSILFGIIQIQTNKPTFLKEKLTNPGTNACPGKAVHNKWGQGKDCVQCPSINKVQTGSFPHIITTEKGTWGFDGFCGFANNYDSNGNINTVMYPNECPINEITNINKKKDIPIYIPSFDQDLRFCLAHPTIQSHSGMEKFNYVYSATGDPLYFASK